MLVPQSLGAGYYAWINPSNGVRSFVSMHTAKLHRTYKQI